MTKGYIIKKFTLVLILISTAVFTFADVYTYSFTAKVWSAYGDQVLGTKTWTAAATGGAFWGYDTNNTPSKGHQFGSSSSPATALSLTTSGISGTITSVKVNTSGASSIVGTFAVSVGGTVFTVGSSNSQALTSTATDYTFTGTSSGSIVLSWTQTSSKALYIKSIEVTYSAAPSCTASNLAFAQSNISKLVADGAFTQTATSLNGTTAITYSSSNQAVATVNETTGQVSLVGAGSTTITATQAAGTHNAVSYCASTATYTLNVSSVTPTITVTEVNVPTMTAYAGASDTENIQVSGSNLTAPISLAITGTNASLFSLSTNSVTQPATVIIYYNPTAPGTHTATLTLTSAGATDVVRTLNGSSTWQPLQTPVATAASNVSNSGFTANWDAVVGATEYTLAVTQVNESVTNTTDLFISEYSEGTSNNKYIEIFNGTGAAVDLSVYTLKQSNNGGGWSADVNASTNLPLTGILANNDVYVVANGVASAAILAQADKTITYNNTVQGGTVPSFNGNDAIGLFKNDVLIDVFGDVSSGTNFDVAGTTGAALDHTIVRKSSVLGGNTNWAASAGTTAENSEWIVNAVDSWTNIGIHTSVSDASETPIAGSPFTVTGENSKTFTGMNAAKTYRYFVVAKNTNVTSAVSNTVSVTTSPNTGLRDLKENGFAFVTNGTIIVNTAAGNRIEIFNAMGQLLTSRIAGTDNKISLSEKGVIIVKAGGKATKLIL